MKNAVHCPGLLSAKWQACYIHRFHCLKTYRKIYLEWGSGINVLTQTLVEVFIFPSVFFFLQSAFEQNFITAQCNLAPLPLCWRWGCAGNSSTWQQVQAGAELSVWLSQKFFQGCSVIFVFDEIALRLPLAPRASVFKETKLWKRSRRLWWIAVIFEVFVGSPTSTPPGSLLSLSPRCEILGQAFLIRLVFLSPKSLSEIARYLVSEQHSVQQSWMPPAVRQAYPPSWIQWSITVRGWVIIIIPSETETQTSCLMWFCPVI